MWPSRRAAAAVLSAAALFVAPCGGAPARGAAARVCAGCAAGGPEQGPLRPSKGLRLGAPVEFDDGLGINAGRCFPLYAGGAFVAWLDSYHRAGPRFYLRRCVEDATVGGVRPGGRGGSVGDVFEELSLAGRRPRFVAVEAPHWSAFASPSFCGPYVAYWGAQFGRGGAAAVIIYAVVFDLNRRRVVRQERLGVTRIDSDSRDFFPAPEWGPDGSGVAFDATRDGLRKITLPVQGR